MAAGGAAPPEPKRVRMFGKGPTLFKKGTPVPYDALGMAAAQEMKTAAPELRLSDDDVKTLSGMTVKDAGEAIAKSPHPFRWTHIYRRVVRDNPPVGWGRTKMAIKLLEEMQIQTATGVGGVRRLLSFGTAKGAGI